MLQTEQVLQGRYQLHKQLGNNAGHQTWLAKDIKTSPAESVTVKLLAFSPQMQWEEFKLFEREAAVLKHLNHPRIPKYRDYFSLDKQTGSGLCWFGLVQDYIPGLSLQQLLEQGKHFSETQVRAIATQVLEILTYLHKLNPPVLHRDIKPSNLILGKDKQVYLVDFGAVQNTAAVEGVTFTVVGTTGYAPLEQFWGKAVPASDLYALGGTLIHLLTGISPADLPQHNLRIQFQDQVSINPALISWIEALTEPDLELRLSSASLALEALKTGRLIRYPLKNIQQNIQPPFRTRIQLSKSHKQLSIKIPGQGILIIQEVINWLGKWIFALICGGYILVLCTPFLVLGAIIFLILFFRIIDFPPVIIIGLMLIFIISFIYLLLKTAVFLWIKLLANYIGNLHFPVYSTSDIKLDRSHFVIKHNYFNFFSVSQHGITSNNTLEVLPHTATKRIFLLSNLKRYYLGKTSTLAECQWLVKEIQEWLAEK